MWRSFNDIFLFFYTGSFVGMRSFDSTEKLNNNSINEKIYGEDEHDETEERHFNEMLCSVGAKSLFDE